MHEETRRVLIKQNDTHLTYAQDKTIHQLFEEQVERTPHAVAVVFEDQELTYQQLNEKSNRLAYHLRYLGVGPDTLVAIAVEKSLEMIIGLFAILKAGGAYIPLDPRYPKERLSFLLKDTKAPILLTQPFLKDLFKLYPGHICSLSYNQEKSSLRVQDISRSSQQEHDIDLEQYTSDNLPSLSTPQHLAYVIYTSGSTGQPKGVAVEHKSLCHLLLYFKDLLSFTPQDHMLSLAELTFDIFGLELYLPLFSGAKTTIVPYKTAQDPHLLTLLTQKVQPTFIQATPSTWKMIVDTPLRVSFPLTLLCGGESLPPKIAQELFLISSSVWNVYGPTETTIWSSCTLLSAGEPVSIGKPIANTQIYILDHQMNPLPVNVRGEVYIGGEGLARGYWNRPDLTAEKFVPNPFVSEKDQKMGKNLRLYRTGDLARYLPDGNIDFLSRIDNQVKIRGFRIELGEIESTLQNHEDVIQAIVMAREDESDASNNSDNSNHKKLVAYVVLPEKKIASLVVESALSSPAGNFFSVLKGESLPCVTENLRTHLAQFLPDYMIPSFFVYIDKVPLTSNDKVDRKALPTPDLSLRPTDNAYVAPQSQCEQELANIWSEVLKIEKIGTHDNFFKMGGDSLIATQIISRIRRLYNCDLSLKSLFERPTIAEFASIVTQTLNTSSSILPLVPQARPDPIPLSFAQQRLWFLDQLLEKNYLYNISAAFKLTGPLKIESLEQALNTLIQRHESLRTVFPSNGGEAMQCILSSLLLSLKQEMIDPTLVNNVIYQEALTPFDLAEGPLLRVKLLTLSSEEHILLITLHHIVSDGWSMEIFFQELSFLYEKFLKNQEGSLPAPPLQYADFALWQREYLKGDILEKQLLYWKTTLSDIPELLTLPTDYPRPPELTYQGGRCEIALSKEIQKKLHLLSQSHNCSLFMILLSGLQILLKRYSGQDDIVVGSPIANRNQQEIEGLIGFFVNTLALRTIFEENQTFLDVLTKVKETTLSAYQHQDLPFEQLVDHLEIPRALNHNPVFQVLFVLQNASHETSLELAELKTEPIPFNDSISKFDLTISAYEYEEGIRISIDYLKDIFEASTVKRFAHHFENLIAEILKDPNQLIDEIPILTQEETQRILIEWNDTKTEYLKDKTIHQLFEEQVERTPHAVAIVFEDQQLTYQQLNERSNQLAHHLRHLGVGPETLVAIAVEHSLEMIIGLLGILKAGGAYVPLDPTYPEERLAFLLEDTKAKILLTQPFLKERFKTYQGHLCSLSYNQQKTSFEVQVMSGHSQIEQDIDLKQYPADNLPSLSASHHLAYVIYTSGSTGKPKGVGIEHGSLTQYIQYGLNHLATPIIGTSLLHSSIAFDMSITSLFISLVKGNALTILSPEETRIEALMDFLKKNPNLNLLKVTPSHLKAFKNYLNPQEVMGDNTALVIGGETLLKEDIEDWIPSSESSFIVNHYGPTEATVGCCVFKLKDIGSIHSPCIPIGKPISNTQIYILDHRMNPVPINVPGEIYIGGEGLARGYLNRPDLTAERFIPNPFESAQDQKEGKSLRLYRTGDLARHLPDGNIEFLGRIDDQVKIRGFRIECKEIESLLNSHGDVSAAIVLARDEDATNKKLVAYIVPGEFTPSPSELREFLEAQLPDYMIPSFFVMIDKIPLTSNGKLDKKALPAPDLSVRLLSESYVAPRTPIESDLATVWSEVLRIPQVGIHDNFFRIGGDSIVSIQLMAKARKNNLFFTIRDVFQYPTIAELARVTTGAAENVIKLDQGFLTGPLPLLPIQHWFFEQNFPHKNHFNQDILLKLHPSLNCSLLKEALLKLLSHHDLLRASYKKEGASYYSQA